MCPGLTTEAPKQVEVQTHPCQAPIVDEAAKRSPWRRRIVQSRLNRESIQVAT